MDDAITLEKETLGSQAKTAVIDCDVHNAVPSIQALFPYLPDRWRDYVVEHGIKSLEPNYYPRGVSLSARPDSLLPNGDPPGSDLEVLRRQVLEPWNMQYAILNCLYGVQMIHNEDWAAAMARAVNDWQIAEWLDKEQRLRASIVVASQNPEQAAEEIHRLGQHPGFVQVLLMVRSEMLYGKKHFWPIYEAAQQYGLVIGIHAGGVTGYPTMPVGWPSYYLEDYVSQSQAFQSQIVSLICEGTFQKFPRLRVTLLESGFAWMPALMWRLDKNWKGLRREIPWVDRLPSEIIREHFRLTIQPLDESPKPEHLLQTMEQMRSQDMLLFSTDYPHWHFDEKEEALPANLPPSLEKKILSENARSFYRFD
ncbi:amidohydrolase family protein [Fictibacillus sp. NRS-1165]|uniref:amidohydrolase family protein n=1 Tax=Fictibacillus sp. NRS-1165 TaxID=3144463 RepID=UPI003D236A7C